jgi:hypothetical protein
MIVRQSRNRSFDPPHDRALMFALSADRQHRGYAASNPIDRWKDGSRYGLDPTSSGANRPTILANFRSGMQGVRFVKASSHKITSTAWNPTGVTGATFFFAMSISVATASCFFASPNTSFQFYLSPPDTSFYFYLGSGYYKTSYTPYINKPILISVIYDGTKSTNATKFRVFFNGVQDAAGTWVGSFPATFPTTTGYTLGWDPGGSTYLDVTYGDVLVYDKNLSVPQHDDVAAALKERWGINSTSRQVTGRSRLQRIVTPDRAWLANGEIQLAQAMMAGIGIIVSPPSFAESAMSMDPLTIGGSSLAEEPPDSDAMSVMTLEAIAMVGIGYEGKYPTVDHRLSVIEYWRPRS